MSKGLKKALLLIIPCLAAGGLYAATARSDSFANYYALHIYPLFVGTVGRLWSTVPVSAAEIGMYILAAALLISFAVRLILVCTGRRPFWRSLGGMLYRLFTLAGILGLIFMLLGGVNYKRETFANSVGLLVEQPDREELREFLGLCRDRLNELAPEITKDGFGNCGVPEHADAIAVQAMRALGEKTDLLGGYYPKPKYVLWSDFLSYQKITGIYSPFTVEANVNGAQPGYELPHTLCHELSHLKGFMREDEANFLGWLACVGSDSPEFRYSGWIVAYIYAGNDLARYDREAYTAIRDTLDPQVLQDLNYGSAFWAKYDGLIADAHEEMNDTYLKVNHQEAGVESYNHVVELLLSYIRQNETEGL